MLWDMSFFPGRTFLRSVSDDTARRPGTQWAQDPTYAHAGVKGTGSSHIQALGCRGGVGALPLTNIRPCPCIGGEGSTLLLHKVLRPCI